MKTTFDVMTKEIFTDKNNFTLPYRLYVPENYTPDKKYDFLLFLHGAGERGDDNELQIKYNVGIIERIINDDTRDCIIAAPQCPNEMQWVDTPWADGSYTLADVPPSRPIQAVDELLTELTQKYNIDQNRMYVSGISMGGFGSWNMLMRRPEVFAAAVIVCGGADPICAEVIKHIPVRTFHSDNDPSVPVSGTREMVAALKNVNADVEYIEYQSDNHDCWTDAFNEPWLIDWLFSQSKNK